MPGTIINPATTATEVATIVDASQALVQDRFAEALDYADGTMNTASAFLNELRNAAASFSFSITALADLGLDPLSYDFEPGDAPADPDVALEVPALPDAPTLEVITIEPQAVPSFDDVAPTIAIPDAPSGALPDPPTSIPTETPITFPDAPDTTLPDLPTFHTVTIPEAPIADYPAWDGTAPTENLTLPQLWMNIQTDTYESAILTALQAQLLDRIQNGGTGLDSDVEDDIWRRNEERDRIALDDAKEKISAEWSDRGFDLPDGVLVAQLTQVETEYVNKRLDASRDIAVKQAELAYAATRDFIQQGITLETTLINWANAVGERTFQSTKALQDAAVAVYNAALSRFSAQLELYKTKAAVYETRIRGEIGKAEFYKAQIGAAQATAEVNRAYADLYRLQIQGVEELIKMYLAEMEGAKVKVEIDRNRVAVFSAQLEAYTSRVNSKVAEFNMHRARIEGEKAKADVYASQVDAYTKRVSAAQTQASIRIEEAKAKTENNRTLVQSYAADIDAYKARLQGLVEEIGAVLKAYETKAQIYRSRADASAAIAGVDVKAQEAVIQGHIAQMQLFLKQAEINIQSYAEMARLRMEAAKGGAAVAAQLAAGIFSGTSIQAHLGANANIGKSYSGQESVTESFPHEEQP